MRYLLQYCLPEGPEATASYGDGRQIPAGAGLYPGNEVREHARSGYFTKGFQNGDMVEEMHDIRYHYHVDMGRAVYIDGLNDESNWYAVSEDGNVYKSVGNRDYQFSALYYKRGSQEG